MKNILTSLIFSSMVSVLCGLYKETTGRIMEFKRYEEHKESLTLSCSDGTASIMSGTTCSDENLSMFLLLISICLTTLLPGGKWLGKVHCGLYTIWPDQTKWVPLCQMLPLYM